MRFPWQKKKAEVGNTYLIGLKPNALYNIWFTCGDGGQHFSLARYLEPKKVGCPDHGMIADGPQFQLIPESSFFGSMTITRIEEVDR